MIEERREKKEETGEGARRPGGSPLWFLLSSLFFLLTSVACAAQDPPKKPKGKDGPGDPERREKFLAGDSAAEARSLVETNKPLHLDAVAQFFRGEKKPYTERLAALRALKLLREQDDEEYRRVYSSVKPALSLHASRGLGAGALPEEEVEMLLAALSWHVDMKYDHARMALEYYVDTDQQRVRIPALPERVRVESARLLAAYAPQRSSRDILWNALVESWEKDSVRDACYRSLRSFDPDLRDRVLSLTPAAKDHWMEALQSRLKAEK